jgi:hypothetical protein
MFTPGDADRVCVQGQRARTCAEDRRSPVHRSKKKRNFALIFPEY